MGGASRWYASKQDFRRSVGRRSASCVTFIKNHPKKSQYKSAGIDRIEIERTRDEVRVMLYVARPGLIIGKKGQEIETSARRTAELDRSTRINLKVEEVGRDRIAGTVGRRRHLHNNLQKRSSFRRTMKRSMEQTMDAGAKGIKIQLAGRLGGAEMARREKQIAGSIPLEHTASKN